jgi:hypothetical protein
MGGNSPQDLLYSGLAAGAGHVFVLGSDGALNAFATTGADRLPPDIDDVSMVLPRQQNGRAYRLRTVATVDLLPPPSKDQMLAVSGAPPLWLAVPLSDQGSGVNPDTAEILINGVPAEEEEILYDSNDMLLWWFYEPQEITPRGLDAGTYRVTIRAADWSGNMAEADTYFRVDKSLAEAKVPGEEEEAYYGLGGRTSPTARPGSSPGVGPSMGPGTSPGVGPGLGPQFGF